MEEWQEACWSVIDAYFQEKGLVQQQLSSFNEFIEVSIQQIIAETPPIDLEGRSMYTESELTVAVSLVQPFFFSLSLSLSLSLPGDPLHLIF